jgi:hypothetical protein
MPLGSMAHFAEPHGEPGTIRVGLVQADRLNREYRRSAEENRVRGSRPFLGTESTIAVLASR